MNQQMVRSFAFVLLMVSCSLCSAQDILLLTEDFELSPSSFLLNGAGPGSNTGDNQWIINNQYTGDVNYPNTTSESITNGGTIGFAPYSNYLHIYDQPSGVLNACYDPTAASDRFTYMEFGLCTYSMEDVHFSFFYLCQGSPTAYGSIYYSADGGPWTQFGLPQYLNTTTWQYVDITDPAFSNVGDLRFGFRWQNNSGAPPYTMSFGIDDITVVASYSETDPVTISVTSVSPIEVCQGGYASISYQLSDTLCDGTYQIELSNSVGNFTGQFGSWVFNINYPQTSGTVTVQVPSTAPVGGCYKFRINRLSPPPEITGIASLCFSIIQCPNIITTMQPVVTLDTNAVCIGSVIDVPFTSTGVYAANNDYVAQLSDADGTFPGSPEIIGSSDDNNTYDPALGDMPGSVGGLIPVVEPGCNYYIRIVSTNPVAIGSVWGPFCIQECDITTNNMQDLSFCVNECSVDPDGENELIDIDVNTYDNTSTYLPGNVFTTQLLSSMTFAQIGSNGILGEVAATDDTQLNIHIPCKDSLAFYGLPLGMNYLRIVATNSTTPDNTLGSLIHLTIGAYSNEPQVINSYEYPTFIEKDVFCVGETALISFQPYDYFANSTYMWQCNGINGGNPFVSPSGANSNSLYVIFGGAGNLTFSVQETNYGCVSPWTPVYNVTVLGDPNANIIGPNTVCQGEIAEFHVNFYPNTYYSWSTNATIDQIAYQDTSNNELNIAFNEVGNYTLSVDILNYCGSDSDDDSVTVLEAPEVVASADTTICLNGQATVSVLQGANYTYDWTENGSSIANTPSVDVSPPETTDYIIEVDDGNCFALDTVQVIVELPEPPVVYTDSLCPGGLNQLTLVASSFQQYLWSTGETSPFITATDTGTYIVQLFNAGFVCPMSEQFDILPLIPEDPIQYIDSICPGGGNSVTLMPAEIGNYLWSTNETTQSIVAHDVGEYSVAVYNTTDPCPHYSEWDVQPIEPDPPILLTDSVCPGAEFPITLHADRPGQYAWSTGEYTGLIHVNDTGIYVVTIYMPEERCERTLQWTVTADTCYAMPELLAFVPNSFSPDGDGLNDYFIPVFSDPSMILEYQLSIYNRWGTRIFETNDVFQAWIGNTTGGEYFGQDGVYIWQITYKAKGLVDEVQTMGHVVLLR